jgi:DNA helicase HerA-like ATPase
VSTEFVPAITAGYGFEGPAVELGAGMHAGATHPDARVRVPLAMLNRHGLVAGATGTGKTKTLQVMAEQLSLAGVPVFISDIKGDISGLGAPGVVNERVEARVRALGLNEFAPRAFPVEFFTLVRDRPGVRLRATVESFGPILLAKVLELNETQESVLSLAFKYAEDKRIPLVTLADLRALLNHLDSDQGKAEMEAYGGVSKATTGVMIRRIVGLEQQDADAFFGEPAFEVADFLRAGPDGQGIVSVLELADMQDRPVLFSTFLLWLLARLYESLPEVGDLDRPKLVFFFDEAHLLFRDANTAFLRQIELVARLIRSKGVGVFFVTHAPRDVPGEVLGQLGNRVQHALRAFTPDDLETVKATAETFPVTELYDVDEELTQLGIGEALVTALGPTGVPMPTVRTLMRPPMSLMAQLDAGAFAAVVDASAIAPRYATDARTRSADDVLTSPPTVDVRDPKPPSPRGRRHPTRPPERGVDWGDVAQEGARLARSGTVNTILRAILRAFGPRR